VIRRLFRIVFRLAVLSAVGFALFKLVQTRRSSPSGMPSGDPIIPPSRPNQPLVEPSMLQVERQEGGEAKAADGQRAPSVLRVETAPEPDPAAAAGQAAPPEPETASAATKTAPAKAWVDPQGSFCPSSHPVKAKLASGIFHLPGMTAYERTTPDRCYADPESAEADGLRKAKR
jgi:hypothetical protein